MRQQPTNHISPPGHSRDAGQQSSRGVFGHRGWVVGEFVLVVHPTSSTKWVKGGDHNLGCKLLEVIYRVVFSGTRNCYKRKVP